MEKETIILKSDGSELEANFEYYTYILPAFNGEIDVVLKTEIK